MGVDYDAHFGVGVEVCTKWLNGAEKSGLMESVHGDYQWFLEKLVDEEDEDLKVILSGNHYCDEYIKYYIVIQNPFEFSYDVTGKVEKLKEVLDRAGIKYVGRVDVVGGMEVS